MRPARRALDWWRLALVALWLALAFALPARADDRTLVYRPRLELPLLVVGFGAWTTTEVLKPRLAPRACRLCGSNPLDDGAQQHLIWKRHQVARRASDWLLFAIVPGAALGTTLALGQADDRLRGAAVNTVILGESMVLTNLLTQLTKYTVARARPFVRLQRKENRDFVAGPDDHLSFFSGHTSSTFALAVATATTATLRGQRTAAAVAWPVGVGLAGLTGYFRIAADRHWLTDVITGALVGGLVGVLVPMLHRGEAREGALPAPP
ncbi:MAG: phosphatase PAP2 family protein [Polyangiales bacterium]